MDLPFSEGYLRRNGIDPGQVISYGGRSVNGQYVDTTLYLADGSSRQLGAEYSQDQFTDVFAGRNPTFGTGPAAAPTAGAGGTPASSGTSGAVTGSAANPTTSMFSGLLRQWGLEDLIPEIDSLVRNGFTTEAQLAGQVYDRTTKVGALVDKHYPELRMRQEAGRDATSLAAIRAAREGFKNMARVYDLPSEYVTADRIQRWIVNDVSVKEQEERVLAGIVQVRNAPAETRAALAGWGLSEGALALMVLDDTNEPIDAINRKIAAAGIAGTSQRVGFGALSVQEAERAAALGVTDAQAEDRFGTLVRSRELFQSLDAGEDTISRQDQLAAGLEGNAQAGERVMNRAARRRAQFGGGGSVAQGRAGGLSGLSTANT